MLLLDLDHFKKVNDLHGHAVGDQILKRVTEIINLRIRVTDSLYRIGGEEFVVVLESQDATRAAHLAEQLRTLIQANELVPDRPVTISLGVAELTEDETASSWIGRADEALYRAKRSGRNTTSIAE
jgi:diguanylate cyclase (GGDEF)-like protein